MKKKKALALLLTAAMTVGMLAGCGGSDSAATAGNAETADTAGGSTSGGSTSAAGEEAPDDGEYYVDEDGNKYKNLTMSLSTCLSAGTAALKRRRISTTTT